MHDVIAALAWKQHGAFSVEQAQPRGVTRTWLGNHRRTGLLERRAPGVYVLAASPRTARQSLMVEVLAAGRSALATADSALALWCPELTFPHKPVLAVPPSCGRRTKDAVLRRSADLQLANPGVVDGIPTVGVARALLDASVGRSPDEVLTLIDACRRHSSLSIGALIDVLDQHARPGRSGISTFRSALQRLRRQVTDSEFERLVLRDLRAAGLPDPRLHHVVRLAGQDPIELDLDWPGLLLDLELDGADHKERARRMARDRKRDRLLQGAGYLVARYTWDDYVADRAGMLAEIRYLLTVARAAS
jgi:very-short-patch-repair endonuclease